MLGQSSARRKSLISHNPRSIYHYLSLQVFGTDSVFVSRKRPLEEDEESLARDEDGGENVDDEDGDGDGVLARGSERKERKESVGEVLNEVTLRMRGIRLLPR